MKCVKKGCNNERASDRYCQECIDQYNERHRARYQHHRENGLCHSCNKEAIPGTSRCPECTIKHRAYSKDKQKLVRKERIENGLCGRCGKHPLASESRCQFCLDKHNAKENKYRDIAKAENKCVDCKKLTPMPGKLSCGKCLIHRQENQRKRNEALILAGLCVRCTKRPAVENIQCCMECAIGHLTAQRLKNLKLKQPLIDLFLSQKVCPYSGIPLIPGLNASIDHIVPRAKGGSNEIDNLQWIDIRINQAKSDMDECEFLDLIYKIATYHLGMVIPAKGYSYCLAPSHQSEFYENQNI